MVKSNIARMAWPEVKDAVDRKAVVLIPLGNIEPSGRHSVMGGEIFIADYFAENVAARSGSICMPSVPFGYAPNFMGFPGTLSVRASTLESVLLDLCHAFLKHGFDHIILVNNHSGNEGVVEQAARTFREQTGVLLAKLILPPIMQAVAKDLYPDMAAVHGHGGEPGVSARLFLCPEDMRMDLAVKTEIVPFQGLKISGTTVKQGISSWTLYVDYHETTPSGGTGYPFDADKEKGRIIMERMVDYGVEVVEAFRKINTRT